MHFLNTLQSFRKMPRLVALVSFPKFNTGRHQPSSATEPFLLELSVKAKDLGTADTDRPQLSHMTRDLVCATRRRTVLNETVAPSTWIASPSVKTVFPSPQLSRRPSRSVRLLNGDTPGLAVHCGKKQSYQTSSSRSSSDRRQYEHASTELPISAGIHVLNQALQAE